MFRLGAVGLRWKPLPCACRLGPRGPGSIVILFRPDHESDFCLYESAGTLTFLAALSRFRDQLLRQPLHTHDQTESPAYGVLRPQSGD